MSKQAEIDAASLRVLRAKFAEFPRTADGEVLRPGMACYYLMHGVSLTKFGKPGSHVCECTIEALVWEGRKKGIVAYCAESPATDHVFWASREEAEKRANGNRQA